MKWLIGLVFGRGLLVNLWAHAAGAEISRPFWHVGIFEQVVDVRFSGEL